MRNGKNVVLAGLFVLAVVIAINSPRWALAAMQLAHREEFTNFTTVVIWIFDGMGWWLLGLIVDHKFAQNDHYTARGTIIGGSRR